MTLGETASDTPTSIGIYLAEPNAQFYALFLASYFGMKDHTAVSHNIKKINELIISNESFKLRVESLKNKILTKDFDKVYKKNVMKCEKTKR